MKKNLPVQPALFPMPTLMIGTYNPMTDPAAVVINEDRALYWLSVGALPSDTARGLLKKQGIWEKFESRKAQ